MGQPMDSESFLRRCKEQGAEPQLLEEIDGKSAAEWWRDTNSGNLMRWVLDKIGPELTAEQQNAVTNDPYVKLHDHELDMSLKFNSGVRSGAEKGTADRKSLIVNLIWARANALRKVVGNPFEA